MEVREPSAKYLAARSRGNQSAFEGWAIESLGDISSIERGKFSARPRNDPRLYGGDIPFLQTGDVAHSQGRIRTFSQTLNERGLLVSRLFPQGTLFFTIAANIGDVGIASFAAACPDSLVAITPRDGVSTEWLLHELASKKHVFESLASPGAQLNINLEKLRPYLLAVPPFTEQRAIAEALTDADALIDSLEQLLTKKRQIKQGAMQELLAGQRRLPGFAGLVQTTNLGSVCKMQSGGTPAASQLHYFDGPHPWVAISDITQADKYLTISERSLSDAGLNACAAQLFPAGTVLYAMYASVGECCIAAVAACTSQAILAMQPAKNLDCEYLYYSLLSCKARAKSAVQQGTQGNLNKGIVQAMEIRLPEIAEQQAIARLLSDMDTELTTLESRLTKARALKQAMAQALLTGRIRLVGPSP
jgi:type I restriction enzyme S subunit